MGYVIGGKPIRVLVDVYYMYSVSVVLEKSGDRNVEHLFALNCCETKSTDRFSG